VWVPLLHSDIYSHLFPAPIHHTQKFIDLQRSNGWLNSLPISNVTLHPGIAWVPALGHMSSMALLWLLLWLISHDPSYQVWILGNRDTSLPVTTLYLVL
jgi:hypothetical protein